ncbi:MAG TPA: hypothetical protein VFX49_21500 [Chloroflexota bacterium]|nr:hypothetical protein [Chloroflexota bacterium]
MWGSSLFRRLGAVGRRGGAGDASSAERAARWLRDKLESEARAHFGWLDAGVWAGALHGVPRDTAQAARRLTAASVLGDEVLG